MNGRGVTAPPAHRATRRKLWAEGIPSYLHPTMNYPRGQDKEKEMRITSREDDQGSFKRERAYTSCPASTRQPLLGARASQGNGT